MKNDPTKVRQRIIGIRVNQKEAEVITEKAIKYAKGSLSGFVRDAVKKYHPRKTRTKIAAAS